MKNRKKIICLLLTVFVFLTCIGAGKTDPVLNPEKTIIYKAYSVGDIGKEVDKNDDIVFIGGIGEINGNQKNVIIKSGIYTIDVNLKKKLDVKKGERIQVFGRVESNKNNIVKIEAQEVYRTNDEALNKEFYFDTSHSYSTNNYREVGIIKYDYPENWDELDGTQIFNSNLKKNAACYKIGENEYASIFYFEYKTFVKHPDNDSKKNKIESAIIKNICPNEEKRISLFNRVPQDTYEKPYDDTVKIDSYVADGGKWHVEFSFQEVEDGLIVVVYQYNRSKEHFRDVLYMMRTIH